MRGVDLIQKYQTALGIQEPERSYTTGNSPPLVSALLAARPQRGVRPFSYVCTDTNQFSRTSLMFSSSVQRGPHVAECDLLRSLAPGLSSLSAALAVLPAVPAGLAWAGAAASGG